jgi:hypothetical protein
VSPTTAAVWVEIDGPAEVDVLRDTARTFRVAGHHYALVVVRDLLSALRRRTRCGWMANSRGRSRTERSPRAASAHHRTSTGRCGSSPAALDAVREQLRTTATKTESPLQSELSRLAHEYEVVRRVPDDGQS